MRLGLGEILRKAGAMASRAEKVDFLVRNESESLKIMLRLVYEKQLELDLPKGWRPDYKVNVYLDQESVLIQEARKFNKYLVDGYPGLTQDKKVKMFTALLESVPADDALLLIGAKDKKMPFPGVTRSVVEAAFPGLLQDKEAVGEADA